MQTLLQDLKYGVRMLARVPGFTIIVVFTLALGIGANTAIFSVINATLLARLPYSQPDRIVMVWEHDPSRGFPRNSVSPGNFLHWQEANTVLTRWPRSSIFAPTLREPASLSRFRDKQSRLISSRFLVLMPGSDAPLSRRKGILGMTT